MHPQIVRSEPGSCPICGMALEPMTPAGVDAENPELRDMTRRFWVGVMLSTPLLAMAMAEHLAKPMLDALIAPRFAVWVQLILGTRRCCGAAGRFSWYRELAERAGNPVIWEARLRMAEDLDEEARGMERADARFFSNSYKPAVQGCRLIDARGPKRNSP